MDFGDFDARRQTPDPFDAFDDLDAPAAPPDATEAEPPAADVVVTPGAAAPKEDFRAYDVETPACPPAEAAPPAPPAADEWSALRMPRGAAGGGAPAEAEDFGDFDAAPPADCRLRHPAPEEDPWSAFDAITPPAPTDDAPPGGGGSRSGFAAFEQAPTDGDEPAAPVVDAPAAPRSARGR